MRGISQPIATEPVDDPLASLAREAAGGDPTALRGLLRALAPEVARVARAILGPSNGSLEDAVQDALLSLIHALPSFRGECSARRFANRIAARTALHTRRRAQAHERRETAAASIAMLPAHDDAQRSARRDALLAALLDSLPERQAEVLILRFVLGYSLDETAAAVQAPANTVRSRIRLAKESLRERMADDPAFFELLRDGE